MKNEATRTAMKIAGLEIERDSLQRCVTELESTIAAQAAVIEAVRFLVGEMKIDIDSLTLPGYPKREDDPAQYVARGLESDRWELAIEAAAERGNFGEPTDDDLAEGWRRCVALAMEYERSQAHQDKEVGG
jgi:hypothetical protein